MSGRGADEVDDVGEVGDRVAIWMAPPSRGREGGGGRLNHDALSFHPERWAGPADEPVEDADPGAYFVQADDLLAQAYCATLVRGLAPDQVWQRLGVDERPTHRSVDKLVEDAYEDDDEGSVVGAAPVGSWTLLLEPNGFAGTRKRVLKPLSSGTETVTLFCNVNSAGEFTTFVDGRRALTFDLSDPNDRRGNAVEAYDQAIPRAGFGDDEADSSACGARLMEIVTGVQLSTARLAELSFGVAVLTSER